MTPPVAGGTRGRGASPARGAASAAARLADERAPRRWLVLASLTLISFLLLLDDTAVALALPAIQRRLGLDLAGLEWVVNAYTLPLAALTLLGGRLADRHGRRRVLLAGIAVFVLASLAAGLAGSSPHASADLIAARVLQGVGAALIAPASLAIIAAAFGPDERGVALGIWSGVTATALGLGPVLGAIVTDTLGWAWIFLLNVPLGAVVWLVARYGLSESRAGKPAAHLDLPGAIASGLALSALLLGLTEANDYGWTSARVLGFFGAAVAAAAAFLWIERRSSAPLLDLSRLRTRAVAGPNAVILLATAVMCSLFFFLALYVQTVLGGSALSAGVQLLPLTGTIVVSAPLAGRLTDRLGARVPVTAGMTLLATALLGLSTLRTGSALWSMFPWLALAGLAIGLTTTPATTAAMGGDAGEHGVAAGLLNTFRAAGLALGIAIMGAVLAEYGGGAATSADSFVDGFSAAVTINAGVALLTAVIAAATLSGRPRPCTGRSGLPSRREPRPAPECAQ